MANTLETNNTRSTGFLLNSNPIIRRLAKVQETDAENSCTFIGIKVKLLYFMIVLAIGIALNFFMAGRWGGDPIVFEEQGIVIMGHEAVAVVIAGLLMIVSPILAAFIRVTIPVTGALFCFSTGFVVAWAGKLSQQYSQIIWLALIITAIVVTIMGFLYFSGRVVITKKFRTMLIVLLLTSVGASLIGFILSLIPATKGFVAAFADNAIINILSSVLMVVIASLFLLVDFDEVKHAVDDELPKKYEWSAAFGLAFGVIWLFFKILELLGKVKGGKKS